MSEHKEPIPSMIYNASVGGHVTNSQQIIDENENKEQSQINAEIKQNLGNGGSVDERINQAKTDIIGGASSNGNTLKKIEDRVSPLESAVGFGGTVDSRIAAAKSEIKGNATSACDTLGKAEALISAENTRAQTAEEQLRILYNNLQQSQPIPVTALPETGEAGKIYRLASSTSYSDHMWNGSAWVLMATYDNAIDDEPTPDSDNLVKSSGVKMYGYKNLKDFIIFENYTENYNDQGHNVIPDSSSDLIVGIIKENVSSIKIDGVVGHDGVGIRYSFFDTYDFNELNNNHFIDYYVYNNGYVCVPLGAKTFTLTLRRSDYPNGYEHFKMKLKYKFFDKKSITLKNSLELTPTEILNGKVVFASGEIRNNSGFDVYSYTILDTSKNYFLNVFREANYLNYLVFAAYYDSSDNFIERENITTVSGKDSYIENYLLNIPDGTSKILVNSLKNFSDSTKINVATLIYTHAEQSIYDIKTNKFKETTILTESDIEFVDNYYINLNGELDTSVNTKYSKPIKIFKGDTVQVFTIGTGMSTVCLTNKTGSNYTPLSLNDNSCAYVAQEDTYVAICGRKNLRLRIVRFDNMTRRTASKSVIEPSNILASKYINDDGNIINSTSGNWDVYIYNDIDPENIYLFSGGSVRTSNSRVINFYDENDEFIGYFNSGSATQGFSWEDVYVDMPYNTRTIKINAFTTSTFNSVLKLLSLSKIDKIEDFNELPDYYNNYLKNRYNKVVDSILFSEPNSTSFCFATDLHYPIHPNLGKIVRNILKNTSMMSFICGGDIPNGSSAFGSEITPMEALRETMALYNKDLSFIRESGKPIYTIKGNHDFAINKAYGQGTQDAVYIDWKAARNIIMNDMPDVITNKDDDKACYFYYDLSSAKTRYICIDTTDSNGNDGQNSKSPYVTDTQLRWITEQAFLTTPSDYNIVVLSHIYIHRNCGTADNYSNYYNFGYGSPGDAAGLRGLFDAIQNKKTVTILETNYDFTQFVPNILIHVSGHVHRDMAVFNNGYWNFTTAANDISNELVQSPIYQKFPINTRTVYNGRGTVYENLVDAVFVNGDNDVKVFRFGAGYDRIFQLKQIDVTNGTTAQMITTIDADDIQWWCYDSTGRSQSTQYAGYQNLFATIGADTGVLSATSQGYVTVVAYSQSKNTVEFIGVKII